VWGTGKTGRMPAGSRRYEETDSSRHFLTRQKGRDDFGDREKLILLVTFRGSGLLAPDNPNGAGQSRLGGQRL